MQPGSTTQLNATLNMDPKKPQFQKVGEKNITKKLTSQKSHPQAHVAAELASVGCAAPWPPHGVTRGGVAA
jgi:hypothetical protein